MWRALFSLQIGVFLAWRRGREPHLARASATVLLSRASPLRAEERARPLEHPIEPTAESLWDDVAGRLRGALNEKTFGNWFSEVVPVAVDDDAFVLGVPNDFTREWIEGHFVELIRAAMKDATGAERRLRLTRRGAAAAPARRASRSTATAAAAAAPPPEARGRTAGSSRSTRSTRS